MNRREFLCIRRCSHVTNGWWPQQRGGREEGRTRRRNTPAVIENDDVLLRTTFKSYVRSVKEGWPFTIFSFNKCIMYQVQKNVMHIFVHNSISLLCKLAKCCRNNRLYYISFLWFLWFFDADRYRYFFVIWCHHHVGSSFLCIVFSLNIKESCCGVTHVLSVHQPFFEDHLHLFAIFAIFVRIFEHFFLKRMSIVFF